MLFKKGTVFSFKSLNTKLAQIKKNDLTKIFCTYYCLLRLTKKGKFSVFTFFVGSQDTELYQ